MNNQQEQEIMKLLKIFCSDNMGNYMNQWLSASLLNAVHAKLQEISKAAGSHFSPNDAKKDIKES